MAGSAVLAFSAGTASAATMTDGGTTHVSPPPLIQIFGSDAADTGLGGAGSWEHTFVLSVPGSGLAQAQISFANFAEFVSPTLSWLDTDGNVLSSSPVASVVMGSGPVSGFGEAITTFTDPDSLSQRFVFSWAEGTGANAGFDVSVQISLIPLPASALLLLGGMGVFGGMAAMRRRRDAASA